MNSKKLVLRIDDLFCFLVFLYPIVRYYKVPIIGVGFESIMAVLICIIGLLLWLKRFYWGCERELLKSKRFYLFFLVWAILITLYYELFTGLNYRNPIANYNTNSMMIFFVSGLVIFFILRGIIRTDNCLKIYTGFVYMLLVIVIIQWLLLTIGMRINFKLPFEYTSDWSYMSNKIFGMNSYPTGLFSERSHLCEYLCPYVALCLFSNRLVKERRIAKAVLLSAVIIGTASGNGIIVLLIEWVLWFLGIGQAKENIHLSNRIIIVVIGFAGLIGMYLFLSSIPRFATMFNTLFFDSTGSQYTSSKADYRIYRGFDIFFRLPFFQKFTGVGFKHMYMFAEVNGIKSVFDYFWKDVYEYFSAISMVMLYFGFIGLVFFMLHLWEIFKCKIDVVRGLIIVMIALFFSCEMLLNYSHIMFCLIIVMAFSMERINSNSADLNRKDVYNDKNRHIDFS